MFYSKVGRNVMNLFTDALFKECVRVSIDMEHQKFSKVDQSRAGHSKAKHLNREIRAPGSQPYLSFNIPQPSNFPYCTNDCTPLHPFNGQNIQGVARVAWHAAFRIVEDKNHDSYMNVFFFNTPSTQLWCCLFLYLYLELDIQ